VPGHLANPVWVDDEHFDLGFHVRRSALPRPGREEQLRDLVARLMSRPLDRLRPLWEMYLVEGLTGGRFALVSKTHQAMIDGVSAVDIGQVVLDSSASVAEAPPVDTWHPTVEPSSLELVAGALSDAVRRPTELVETARSVVTDWQQNTERVLRVLGSAAGGLATAMRTAASPAPPSPLNAAIGAQRRFMTVETPLESYRLVRSAVGSSVNDVVLATIAGALRSWLFARGVAVRSSTAVRAMVPLSVSSDSGPQGIGSRVTEYLVDLPVGEASPAMRLHQVSYAMKAHRETGRAVDARSLAGMAGFGPPTLHALGARAANTLSRRVFNLVVTNVPGPQTPLYVGGAPMLATYPVVPLAKGQALAIGLTSYNGRVCFGLNGDRDAMADLSVLAASLPEALAELEEAVRPQRARKNVAAATRKRTVRKRAR
jgi:WS/DGAT/MGAT family acyltransferase